MRTVANGRRAVWGSNLAGLCAPRSARTGESASYVVLESALVLAGAYATCGVWYVK